MSTRQALIESMGDLLWERGYSASSPREVLRRSGAGEGSMYHHFPGGKAQLALTAEGSLSDSLKSTVRERLSTGTTARERLEAFFAVDESTLRGCRIGGLAQDPGVFDDDALRAPVGDTLDWVGQQLREVLADGVASGELAATLDIDATAAALNAVRQGGYVLARAGRDPALAAQAARGLLELLLASDG